MKKILLIEDDVKIGRLLKEYMSEVGYELIHITTPKKGIELLKKETFDSLILDIMLPEMSGFDVCKKVRTFSEIPIIMLTARGDVTDKVVGLEIGADDYMSKPFSPRELVARLESIGRRTQKKVLSKLTSWIGQGLVVDFVQFKVEYKEEELSLTTAEFELLKIFIKNTNIALSRDDIMNELQGVDSEVFSRSIDIAVSRLRQKLHDDKDSPRFIKTIWGSGYMFIASED